MFWRMVLISTLIPLLELFFLYYVLPKFFVLFLTVITGILGALLLYWQGRRSWDQLNRQLDFGETPTATALNGGLILIAGALLITPGLMTAFLGLLLLVPLLRMLVVSFLLLRFEVYRHRPKSGNASPTAGSDTFDV